ncbi:MAG: membrane protein insertase YidC [Candidatus Glassbacteria bacterium]|nr:membrane protein insertase YidC [Candidatus Glassbacteria bacterium]
MEKNAALAMALIFGLWMFYILVMAPRPQPLSEQPLVPVDSAARTVESRYVPPDLDSALGARAPGLAEKITDSQPADTMPVDTVVVSSNIYEYHFITRGGVLSRALLKKYPAFRPKGSDSRGEAGPVQLIPPGESEFLRTSLHLKNLTQPIELGERHFVPSSKKIVLSGSRTEADLEFVHELAGGNRVRIVYSFDNDTYLVGAKLYLPDRLHGPEENRVEVRLGPSLVSNEKNPDEDYAEYEVVYFEDGELTDKDLGDLEESDWSPSGERRILWGGLKSKYFIAAFFVPESLMVGMRGSGDEEARAMAYSGFFKVPPRPGPIEFSFYVGPQAYEELTKLNYGMGKLVEYGWWIIKPFCKYSLQVMLWMHQYISNYALVLIFFALAVKVVFWPLTIKSTKSQIKMQQIQPLVQQVKDKYKDDPQKVQQETMRLYKEHKVNPLGGCLPILVQMPVLIALFYVFRMTIEFRGAEAFGWINDLSQPDPYYILPIVMGLTQFVTQKMMPTSMDPKMKPMLYMMPAVMVFIFLRFSVGLVFYYTWVNIFQMVQQIYINRQFHGEDRNKVAVAKKNAGDAAKKPARQRKKKK